MTGPEREEIDRLIAEIDLPLWQPLPGPQSDACVSEADELFYGGAAGGGKSDLILGLALTAHRRSAIFRRVYPNLRSLIDRSIEIVGDDRDFNKTEKIWRLSGKVIEFGAVQYEESKKNWQGRPHDLKAFDEITEFTRTQYLFIIGWNRSADGIHCRVVCTGNPPTDESGSWVIDEWGPWLIPDHPHRAEPGELRWYYYDGDRLVWLNSGEPVEVNGETIYPRSRTFIPAKLEDNPYLASDNRYRSVLQSLPEPLRSQLLHGDFTAGKQADPWQVIPTAWVKLAQQRWMERQKPDMPLSGVGGDMVRGGKDALALAKRYGTWFDEVIKVPGVNIEDGPAAAAVFYQELQNERNIGYINIDVAGVGSSPYDSMKVMWPGIVHPVNAAAGSDYVVKAENGDVVLKMKNLRAEYHWRLRLALDPVHGDNLALPPGNEIVADLCAAKYKMLAGGVVQIEDKDAIKERIGRSPDVGEAIMMAFLQPSIVKPEYHEHNPFYG